MDTCQESLVAACEATKLNRSSYPPSGATIDAHTTLAHRGDTASVWVLQR